MSKAFTRESDDLPERPALRPRPSALPPGAKNYFTPDGVDALRRELEALASAPETPAVRQRVFEIGGMLASAVVNPPPAKPWDRVLFGATVRVRDEAGHETVYRIVGAHQTDLDRDWISWLSPLARALLQARLGERVRFRAPAGEQLLEILAVDYE